ncbi:MAG: phage shock protein PspA [Gammaproteobacteria bacterium]|nr:phage shock protein PspA [Gammaproteobacteria bacterium]MDH3768355.1 phage shock protein PspA [Gammaproteobacteria bacterium]
MGIFSRFTDIVNSNINAILEKAEDPEKMVRLMIQEMEDTLVEVRSSAARAIADKKELNRKLESYEREESDWQRKAELAVSKGRDDLAKAAIAEKHRLSEAIAAVRGDYQAIDEGLSQLNDDLARLQEKLGDAKTRQKALIMRHATATKRLDVREQLHNGKIDDALVRFEAYERRMEDLEGRVESYDLGLGNDLNYQFADLETDESVEEELADLKKRISQSANS